MHEHYDVEGNLTGRTVVTREPEWDDDSRGRALALQEYEDSTINGMPAVEAYKDQPFKVHEQVNFAARAVERHKRAERDRAEAAAKAVGKKLPEDWDVGRSYVAVLPDPSELREDRRGD